MGWMLSRKSTRAGAIPAGRKPTLQLQIVESYKGLEI